MKSFFKYKSLSGDSFKYFVKMLTESNMYAPIFKELNDPMEGAFLTNSIDNQEIEAIQNGKDRIRIISMVEKKEDNPCNILMWSHYTDEHHGCCIEFHFTTQKEQDKVREVEYVDKIEISNEISVEDILSRKFVDWKYEQEVRHLGTEKTVPIVIDKIYLGMRIDDMYNENDTTNESFYRELIKRLCPNVEIIKMRAEDFDGHHWIR